MRRAVVVFALVACACGSSHRPAGSPSDVKTREGTYEGCRVKRFYDDHYWVIGRGTRRYAELHPETENDPITAFHDALIEPLGPAFEAETGVTSEGSTLHLHDFRRVDAAIRRVCAILHEHRLNERVVLLVEPPMNIVALER